MARELRRPKGTAEFNAVDLPLTEKTLTGRWWNLRWRKYSSRSYYFHSTLSGRLTPSSEKVPCLYLARNRETSFYEIYGDDIYVASAKNTNLRLAKSDLENRVLMKTLKPCDLKLYDLATVRGAKRVGMDLGTLYAPDVSYARDFAQRIHDHPAKFDGIQYQSRHTQALCVVLWATHNSALKKIDLELSDSLWNLAEAGPRVAAGSIRIFDATVEVSAPPP